MKKEKLYQPTLASYAVMKSLSDSNDYQNSYEILADFIRYIIVDRKWHEFTTTDITNALKEEFGFDNIPFPAIKTSLRQIKECKKQGNDYYVPDNNSFKTEKFQRAKQISAENSQSITQSLFDFAREHCTSEINSSALEEAFIKYLLDDTATIDPKSSDIISKFILANTEDKNFQNKLAQIREGSILYCGLAYNISELGSITNDLTLYLDTEVLFNIAGYNGELYHKLAEDFLDQVKLANIKQKKIKLRFFREVNDEIKSFFNSAEMHIRGKESLITSTAMKAIINGCETVGDVRIRESDFFYKLRICYGIELDEKENYYSEADYAYNIEKVPEEFPEDERSFEAVRFISHINKQRKGETSTEYTTCKYLLITETKRIQEISNAMLKNKNECGFALPTSTITNILWYKLGSGFRKKDYPLNTDTSYKARAILSGELTNNISRLYEDTQRQYEEGIIDREQVAERIILLRDKNRTPDEVTADNINELLDFSPEYIAKFEEGIKQNKLQLQEKEVIIRNLEEDKLKDQNQKNQLEFELAQANRESEISIAKIEEQNETIKKQNEELEQYRAAERKRTRRIKCLKKLFSFIGLLLLYAGSFVFFVIVVNKIMESFAPQLSRSVSIVIDVAGLLTFILAGVRNAWKKVYGKKNKPDTDNQ